MPYLLDGNNLIGRVRRTARPSEEDRAALVAEIAERLRRTRARATLYFDGPAGERPSSLGSLTIRTASGSSADEAILREIERSRVPGELVVVTGDRELSRRAQAAGARVTDPAEFFKRFGAGEAGPVEGERAPATPAEIDDWMRYFEKGNNRSGDKTK
jgi:hypothetical protein